MVRNVMLVLLHFVKIVLKLFVMLVLTITLYTLINVNHVMKHVREHVKEKELLIVMHVKQLDGSLMQYLAVNLVI